MGGDASDRTHLASRVDDALLLGRDVRVEQLIGGLLQVQHAAGQSTTAHKASFRKRARGGGQGLKL